MSNNFEAWKHECHKCGIFCKYKFIVWALGEPIPQWSPHSPQITMYSICSPNAKMTLYFYPQYIYIISRK